MLTSFPPNQNIYKKHWMIAKPLDFNRTLFSDCQQPISIYPFLSPEATLPPYDDIHFVNNQFFTHVFVKCSAVALGF